MVKHVESGVLNSGVWSLKCLGSSWGQAEVKLRSSNSGVREVVASTVIFVSTVKREKRHCNQYVAGFVEVPLWYTSSFFGVTSRESTSICQADL